MLFRLESKKFYKDKNLIEYKYDIIGSNINDEDEYTKVLVNINPRTKTIRAMKILHPQYVNGKITTPVLSIKDIMEDYESMKKNIKKYHK